MALAASLLSALLFRVVPAVAQGGSLAVSISDDFNVCALEESQEAWAFSAPLGGAWHRTTGAGTGEAWLEIGVPAGVAHDPWNASYVAPRIMRPTSNADFEIEVKFLSAMTVGYQVQGILVEQDPANYVRFDFFHDGSELRIFAAKTANATSTYTYFDAVHPAMARYMRIKRTGNNWTQTYSADGTNWAAAASFSHPLTVARAGVFAANGGTNPPAHTAMFDYVFSTATPIIPEDGAATGQQVTLAVDATGNGTVTRSPDQPDYPCGSIATLTAAPDPGWKFDGWTGDLNGTANPANVILGTSRTVHASFSAIPTPTPPAISNIQVTATTTGAGITWTTDKPATSRVDYGLSSAYEIGTVSTSDLVTTHAILLTDLNASTPHHYRVSATGSDGLATASGDLVFQTAADPSGFTPDDFNVCAVDQGAGAWTFQDPLGGATQRTVGAGTGDAWLEIGVPQGVAHDPWNAQYNAPRLMRPIANTDFELEVKFLSPLTLGYQVQGILVEQDPANYVRLDFFHDGSELRIFAAKTANAISTYTYFDAVHPAMARYMRIKRVGNNWSQTYSADGTNWTAAASFSHPLTVARAGVFAANGGTNPPAHTAMFDYVFSTATPIVPEDGAATGQQVTLAVDATGNGTVTRSPDQPAYSCGSIVTLTATPDAGWQFDGWSGDLNGSDNPANVVLGTSRTVHASFSAIPAPAPPAISNIQVTTATTWAGISWTTNKPSTSRVDYGSSSAYEIGTVSTSDLVTTHGVLLTDLNASTPYHYRVSATGSDGLTATSGDLVFQTAADPSGFIPDDFNVCAVDQGAGAWTFHDPLGGASQRTVGTGTGDAWLEIAVPQGVAHDPWNAHYDAPRLMRPIANTDFELEVKFLSPLTQGYQVQGILIEQDAANYLRFDFFHDGAELKIFAARTSNGVSSPEHHATAGLSSPHYMRIKRVGNEWTQTFSADGANWWPGAQFSHVMTPAHAGIFAANAGTAHTPPPAHVGRFDYMVTTSRRVVPEDGAPAAQNFTLNVDISGNGEVTRQPNLASYACGTLVTLTAHPSPGFTLSGWSGAATGSANPLIVSATQDKQITAEFIVNVPPAISDFVIAPGDNWATLTWKTNEPTTTELAYGLTSAYELGTQSVPGLRTEHLLHVTGLSAQTTYHLRLTTTDADAGTTSRADLVTTTAPVPLAIVNPQVTTTETSATISWETNKPTFGTVAYGLGATFELGSRPSAGLGTTHTVTLTNLTPGTDYFYQLRVTDGSNTSAQSGALTFTTLQIAPVIKLWHGDHQRFGHLGVPQRWINVLGNASDPDGVRYLHFSLNGGPLRPLGIGPDTRRLARAGDFNIELDFAEVVAGVNDIRIIAYDTLDHVSEKAMTIDVVEGTTWSTPNTVDFSTVTDVQDVAQVVDGRWRLEDGALRSVEPGYDRLVAVGDMTWKNYEVTTSVTVHSFDPAGYAPPSYGAVVGLVVRWNGHEVWDNSQPSWGYWPAGVTATYGWQPDGSERVALIGNRDNPISVDTDAPPLQYGEPYNFKVRVETEADGRHRYRFKMWPANAAEPANWQHEIRNAGLPDDPTQGSVLLFSHQVDASFHTITVTPLPELP